LLVVGVSLAGTYWTIERRGLGGLNLVERAYARMWRFSARLGVPSPPDQTPYERSGALTTLVPEGKAAIARITDMYIVERFGQGKEGGDDDRVEEEWTLLRPVLWKSWLQKKFSRFQQQEQQQRWQRFSEAAAPPKPRRPWKT
jgi:hypothetical protein